MNLKRILKFPVHVSGNSHSGTNSQRTRNAAWTHLSVPTTDDVDRIFSVHRHSFAAAVDADLAAAVTTLERVRRSDPTRTLSLRNAFVAEVNRRYSVLRSSVVRAVVKDDVLDLKDTSGTLVGLQSPGYKAYAFRTVDKKVDGFLDWFQKEIDGEILTGPAFGSGRWTDKYVQTSYRKGIVRAGKEHNRQATAKNKIPFDQRAVDAAFTRPIHAERVALLYGRAWNDLKGVTSRMHTEVGRTLTEGFANGWNPNRIARELTKRIDVSRTYARTLARTEVIRAHHVAMVNTYREAGVEGVTVQAEWRTAQDERVCPDCESLEGKVFTLDEIEGMIPLHPNCRCVALPYFGKAPKTRKGVRRAAERTAVRAPVPRGIPAPGAPTAPPSLVDDLGGKPGSVRRILNEELTAGRSRIELENVLIQKGHTAAKARGHVNAHMRMLRKRGYVIREGLEGKLYVVGKQAELLPPPPKVKVFLKAVKGGKMQEYAAEDLIPAIQDVMGTSQTMNKAEFMNALSQRLGIVPSKGDQHLLAIDYMSSKLKALQFQGLMQVENLAPFQVRWFGELPKLKKVTKPAAVKGRRAWRRATQKGKIQPTPYTVHPDFRSAAPANVNKTVEELSQEIVDYLDSVQWSHYRPTLKVRNRADAFAAWKSAEDDVAQFGRFVMQHVNASSAFTHNIGNVHGVVRQLTAYGKSLDPDDIKILQIYKELLEKERFARNQHLSFFTDSELLRYKREVIRKMAGPNAGLTPGQVGTIQNAMYEGLDWMPVDLLDDMQRNGFGADWNMFTSGRAKWSSPQAKLFKNSDATVVAHEFGHALDDLLTNTPGAHAQGGHWIDSYYASKADGKRYRDWFTRQHSKKLGTYTNGDGYYWKDNWIDDYEGRVYSMADSLAAAIEKGKAKSYVYTDRSNSGVEWISMNVQRYMGAKHPHKYSFKAAEWKKAKETYPELTGLLERLFGKVDAPKRFASFDFNPALKSVKQVGGSVRTKPYSIRTRWDKPKKVAKNPFEAGMMFEDMPPLPAPSAPAAKETLTRNQLFTRFKRMQRAGKSPQAIRRAYKEYFAGKDDFDKFHDRVVRFVLKNPKPGAATPKLIHVESVAKAKRTTRAIAGSKIKKPLVIKPDKRVALRTRYTGTKLPKEVRDKLAKREQLVDKFIDAWTSGKRNSFIEPVLKESTRDKFDPEAYAAFFKKMTAKLDAMVEGTSVHVAVPRSVLDDILQSGRMKSFFETQTTGGYTTTGVRADYEAVIFGYKTRALDKKLRPVYGYLEDAATVRKMLGKAKANTNRTLSQTKQYGDIAIRLKDEAVRNRTTFTAGDSLDETIHAIPLASKEKWRAFLELVQGGRKGGEYSVSATPAWHSHDLYGTMIQWRQQAALERRFGAAKKLKVHDVLRHTEQRYLEAQIHRGVSVDDIAEVVVGKGTKIDPATAKALREAKIKVTYVK